jgi:hypothetical protein
MTIQDEQGRSERSISRRNNLCRRARAREGALFLCYACIEIWCVYTGSTCMSRSKRLYSHKKDCENGCSQRQLFVLAREHGWSYFRIRLLES